MISLLNGASNLVFDLWLGAFRFLPPTLQAASLGLPAAALALLVYRYVSNQRGIRAARDKITAHLLELVLFQDDLRVSLRAQGSILRYNLIYVGHALLPMAVMLVPFVLILVQVESRFAYRGLAPGDSVILSVRADDEAPMSQRPVSLVLPPGVVRETPPLRVDALHEIRWRLRGETPGQHRIVIHLDQTQVEKRLVVGPDTTTLERASYRSTDLNTLLYPLEPALPRDGPIAEVELDYPRARGSFWGLSSASWALVGTSLLFGFGLRRLFGVVF